MAITKWIIDPTHSEIHFKVRHLMVSWVTGNFKQFKATLETKGDDITTAKVHFTADINSISTNNDQRDAHLKNAVHGCCKYRCAPCKATIHSAVG